MVKRTVAVEVRYYKDRIFLTDADGEFPLVLKRLTGYRAEWSYQQHLPVFYVAEKTGVVKYESDGLYLGKMYRPLEALSTMLMKAARAGYKRNRPPEEPPSDTGRPGLFEGRTDFPFAPAPKKPHRTRKR